MELKLSLKVTEKTREVQALEQKITQVKHKLRMRAQIVDGLQVQTKHKDFVSDFDVLERLCLEVEEIKDQHAEQAGHNQLLGHDIETLKHDIEARMGTGRGDLSISELNQVFSDLTTETDGYRNKLTTQKRLEEEDKRVAHLLKEVRQVEMQLDSVEADSQSSTQEAEVWRGHYCKQTHNLAVLKETQVALADEAVSHLECIKVLEDKADKRRNQQLHELNVSLKGIHDSQKQRVLDAKRVCKAMPSQEREVVKNLMQHDIEDEMSKIELLSRVLAKAHLWVDDLVRLEHMAKHFTMTTLMRTDDENTRLEELERVRILDISRF